MAWLHVLHQEIATILHSQLCSNKEAIETGKYIAEKAFIVRHNERNAPLKNGRFLGIVHDYCKSTNEYSYYRDNKPYDQNRENSGNCDFHHRVSYFMLLFCVESIFCRSRF